TGGDNEKQRQQSRWRNRDSRVGLGLPFIRPKHRLRVVGLWFPLSHGGADRAPRWHARSGSRRCGQPRGAAGGGGRPSVGFLGIRGHAKEGVLMNTRDDEA
ncbi:hypothetical protein B296_00036600, partial [Ensete ventricosum]